MSGKRLGNLERYIRENLKRAQRLVRLGRKGN